MLPVHVFKNPLYETMSAFPFISYSAVAAQSVSLESSPQPNCPNEPLIFNCSFDFPSFFIRWDHMAFANIVFIGFGTLVGSNTSTRDGRVVAELTMNEDKGGQYLLASTLTIHPPLTDLNNTNLNNTNIMCGGYGLARGGSGVASILLEGKEQIMCLIMYDCITHCLCMYPL